MSLEENKAIIHKMIEAINKRDTDLIEEVMAPNYVDYALQLRGSEADKQSLIDTIKGFPDWHETIEDIAAEGDKVWIRFKATGTHRGELRGVLAPGEALAPPARRSPSPA